MSQRTSTLSPGYRLGDLSKFPISLDDISDLFKATNNAETELLAGMEQGQTICILKDASKFPLSGIIRINDELIFFTYREGNTLYDLHRGFAGTSDIQHRSTSTVIAPYAADMHNVIRDVILKVQGKVGLPTDTEDISDAATLWSRAAFLRRKWFTPKSLFFSHNRIGKAPLGVQFRDFSYGEPIRWVWEFGDGQVSEEQHPFHVYTDPGTYTVSLTVFSNIGSGVAYRSKSDYVNVIEDGLLQEVLFYAETQDTEGVFRTTFFGPAPLVVRLTDQTSGNVQSRIWSFGDGNTYSAQNSNDYQVVYTYNKPGQYVPSLVVTDGYSTIKRNLDRIIEVGVV